MLSPFQRILRVVLIVLCIFFSILLITMGISSNFVSPKMSAILTDMMFTNVFPIAVFVVSLSLVYVPYLEGLELQNYTKHKQLGKYVPNKSFDEAIRRIEYKRNVELSRFLSPYTTSVIHSNQLLKQIIKAYDETPHIDYDYKTDSWNYYLSVNGKVIEGVTGSKVMAICIIYVELFE